MQKKGQLVYKALVVAVAIGLIVVSFLQAGRSYASKDFYYKIAVAKDIALIIDGLYAVPGDARIEYKQDLSSHTVSVSGNTVKVYRSILGQYDITSAEYNFIGQPVPEKIVENSETLLIEKISGKIWIFGALEGGGGRPGGAGSSLRDNQKW